VSDLVRRSLDQRLMFQLVTLLVGAGSLVIVAVGVWGLAHSTVARRWREFGVRLALGARRHEVTRLAMRDAVVVFVTGGSAGLILAWQFGRALESWLFGVRGWDPIALTAAAVLVGVAVFAGNSLPARRAGRMDPAQLLRSE
jgi:ABC-type antimicrobial peptide transport system permease subunit